MTDPSQMLAAYSATRDIRSSTLPNGVRAEQDGPAVRLVGQYRGFVSAPGDWQLDKAELDALIVRQRDYFAARGEAVEWKTWSHDKPTNLTERLQAAAFVAEEQETVLVGLTEQLAVTHAPLPPGIVIRPVNDKDNLDRIGAMETTAWGDDRTWLADDLSNRLSAAPEQIAILTAESSGETVSAAWLVFQENTDFAGLWGGATLPEWRGQGIYRALLTRRAQLAASRGTRYLQVDASEDSRPILQRLGFTKITTTTPYVWTPPPSPR